MKSSGLQAPNCRCDCGYACDRKCGLPIMECMKLHYKSDCEHDRDGPTEEYKDSGGGFVTTVTCSKCGMAAFDHDLMCGP